MNAVRSLVELGEPYKDNHCEQLEAEIELVTRELEVAAKKLRELSALKEQLSPELERLRVGVVLVLSGSHPAPPACPRSLRSIRSDLPPPVFGFSQFAALLPASNRGG